MVSIAGNIAYLEVIEGKVASSAGYIATAMARYIAIRTRNDTLQRTSHGPQEYHQQRPGRPPARGSGRLAKGMEHVPAHKGIRATATVRNEVEYARILEFGCRVIPHDHIYLHWIDSAGSWFHEWLDIPPHPYLSKTTEEARDDRSLTEVAIEEFRKYDP